MSQDLGGASPAPTGAVGASGSPSPSHSAPIGAEPAGGLAPGGASPIDIGDDTPVRWPGEANPIKYGDLQRRLQADHTRKTQAAAKLQRQLEAERTKFASETKAERARLESLAASLVGRQGQNQGQPQWMAELAKKEYITGQDMAAIMGAVQNQGFGAVVQAFQQRDQVIQTMYQLVKRQQAALDAIQGRHTEGEFEGKISNVLKQIGRDPEDYRDVAKEIYLAYEGDDLDSEYPEILRRRLEQIERAIEKRRAASVGAARRPAFPTPGKGGAGVAGKGAGLTGREGSKQTADLLWEMLEGSGE